MKLIAGNIAVLEHDTHISKWVEMTGRLDHDQSTLPLILPFIPEGGVAVDVGAFIGDHTIAYKRKAGPSGKVFAFEPNSEAFECLKHNCPDCVLYDWALGDKVADDGALKHEDNVGATYLSKEHRGRVRIMPLDLTPISFGRLDFVKIDVEGYEVRVLRGAARTIFTHAPVMLIEVCGGTLARNGVTRDDLFRILDTMNYSYVPLFPDHTLQDEQLDILCKPL